jgi:hypothetical protein
MKCCHMLERSRMNPNWAFQLVRWWKVWKRIDQSEIVWCVSFGTTINEVDSLLFWKARRTASSMNSARTFWKGIALVQLVRWWKAWKRIDQSEIVWWILFGTTINRIDSLLFWKARRTASSMNSARTYPRTMMIIHEINYTCALCAKQWITRSMHDSRISCLFDRTQSTSSPPHIMTLSQSLKSQFWTYLFKNDFYSCLKQWCDPRNLKSWRKNLIFIQRISRFWTCHRSNQFDQSMHLFHLSFIWFLPLPSIIPIIWDRHLWISCSLRDCAIAVKILSRFSIQILLSTLLLWPIRLLIINQFDHFWSG